MSRILYAAKAVAAGATAFAGTLATALDDGAISGQEWVTIGVATIVAAAAVFQVRNAEDSEGDL